MVLFVLTAVILILLVLVQKGRGGGLAGAFGGPGGHSAFGTKTADIFVKGTAVVAGIFFVLSILTAWIMRPEEIGQPEQPEAKAPSEPGRTTPAEKAPETGGDATDQPAADPATPGGSGAAAPPDTRDEATRETTPAN